jgi:hypothetical protein
MKKRKPRLPKKTRFSRSNLSTNATAESLEEWRNAVVPGTHRWSFEPVGWVWNLRQISVERFDFRQLSAAFIGTQRICSSLKVDPREDYWSHLRFRSDGFRESPVTRGNLACLIEFSRNSHGTGAGGERRTDTRQERSAGASGRFSAADE